MRPLYLIAGTDQAKIDATRARLRARAEGEGGAAALEVFEPSEGRGAPDHEALLGAIPAMSLTESRRYLLADGVERWRDRQQEAVAAALADLPPDLTVVLIARAKAAGEAAARGQGRQGRGPRVRGAEGAGDAARPGRRRAAARLPARPGRRPGPGRADGRQPGAPRPRAERLALWAGEGGEVTAADLDAMIADTSEAAVWSLSDALLERDAAALRSASG